MQDSLSDKITALKKELEQIPIDDVAAKDHINALIQEIEKSSADSSTDNNFIIDKIKTSIDDFETEHPRQQPYLTILW